MSGTGKALPIDRMARCLVLTAGTALIVMAFAITVDALMRKYAGRTLGGVDEITAYVFAISSTFAFGWTTLQRGHIRIDILRNVLPAPVRRALDVFAWVAFLLVFVLITERAVSLAYESWESGARSVTSLRVPLAWPQALWAFGLLFTCVATLTLGIRAWRGRTTEPLAPVSEVRKELDALNVARAGVQPARSDSPS